mgnify:CR=1 FL=1
MITGSFCSNRLDILENTYDRIDNQVAHDTCSYQDMTDSRYFVVDELLTVYLFSQHVFKEDVKEGLLAIVNFVQCKPLYKSCN